MKNILLILSGLLFSTVSLAKDSFEINGISYTNLTRDTLEVFKGDKLKNQEHGLVMSANENVTVELLDGVDAIEIANDYNLDVSINIPGLLLFKIDPNQDIVQLQKKLSEDARVQSTEFELSSNLL